ncbi:MAG TPA: thioesterase family protein [Candidatus Sulfotelmatobacter sp.]|nr:thioesterase family protein [Candidatus Sulfotelmatobacter sp.]
MADARNAATQSFSEAPSFKTEVLVRFADCDPAGIVFYPRFLEMFNNLVEDWCSAGLNFSFNDIVIKHGWGLPTVHLEADFIAPSRLGEVLTAKLFVRSIGTSSVKADIVLCGPDGSDRVRGKVVLVLMDRQSNRALAFPDALRRQISTFVVPG